MIKVAICDDDNLIAHQLEDIILFRYKEIMDEY